MNVCPACAKPVDSSATACPHCGISLHQDLASAASPAHGSSGGSKFVLVAIVGIAVVGLLIGILCLGGAAFFLQGVNRAVRMPAGPPPSIESEALPDEPEAVRPMPPELPAEQLPADDSPDTER